MPRATSAIQKIIREPEFAARLEQTADLHPHCPPKHHGRLEWVADQMRKQNITVSNETVRKWFSGESRPTQDKAEALARVFDADASWLLLGEDHKVDVRERRLRNAMADGAVNVVAGFIQMDGGFPAFPEEHDKAAQTANVDLHAIIKGAKYDFHVCLGEAQGRKVVFPVPARHSDVIVLGMVREGFSADIFELTPEIIDQFGKRGGGSIEVTVDGSKLKRVDTFSKRL